MDENTMVEKNLGLVHYILKDKYSNVNEEYDDLFQIGCIGLLKAIRTYDDSRAEFSTWAGVIINNEILNHIKYKKRHVIDELPLYENNIIDDTYLEFENYYSYYELQNKIKEILKKYSEERLKVLELLVYNRLNRREISRILNVDINMVNNTIRSFRRRLKIS